MHYFANHSEVTAALLGALVGAFGGFFLNVVVWNWWNSHEVLRSRSARGISGRRNAQIRRADHGT
jgi:hypothetical protein